MHSANYRRSNKKRPEGEMGNWVKEGRLRDSVHKQISERKAGKLPFIPSGEVVSYNLFSIPFTIILTTVLLSFFTGIRLLRQNLSKIRIERSSFLVS